MRDLYIVEIIYNYNRLTELNLIRVSQYLF